MNSRILVTLSLCLSLLLSLASCGGGSAIPAKPTPPERSNAAIPADGKTPVRQVRQTLNLTAQQTFRAALNALQKRGVPVSSAREDDGIIESDWMNVKDKLCGSRRMEGAPLDCRTRVSVKVEPLLPAASALHVRYEEFCSLNGDTPLFCADSVGERLMISVVEEVAGAS